MTDFQMDLAKEDIDIILKQCLSDKEYTFLSCEKVENVGYVPIGFLSVQSKVCLKYEVEGCIQELHLFLKRLPESKAHKDIVLSCGAFRKEVLVFEKFLMDLRRREAEGDWIPACYLARDEDVIVLNDLSRLGFTNLPLLQPFTPQHIERAIQSLARLHAASLVFELTHNCKISEYLPVLKQEILFSKDENSSGRKAIICSMIALREVASKFLPHYPDELRSKVFAYMDNLANLMSPSSKYPNVFSHSDLWANNMLFRYDEANQVRECCVIDFQVATVKPISYDIHLLIYLCTDKGTRETYYNHFIKYYYQHLSKNLSLKNIELSRLLSWTEYESLVSEMRPLALALAPQYLHFILMPDEIIRDVMKDEREFDSYYNVDRTAYVIKAAEEYPAYKSRLLDSLVDIFEYFEPLVMK